MKSWLHLAHAIGVGPVSISRLINQLGDPDTILKASNGDLSKAGLSALQIESLRGVDEAAIEQDLEWAEAPGRHIMTLDHPLYPALLRQIEDPPAVLYVLGDPEVLGLPGLAMVGSRKPTPQGRQTAEDFAHELAGYGLNINSGLASGIDAAAHRGSLKAGGITIAVAGTGLDRVYPPSNRKLAHEIAEQGALVSEFPIGTQPKAGHFPRRNRIISGLSLGTLVVEAAIRSGSLITARMASEHGREVFAIPGSIHNPMARGCHRLIQQGAKLVESAGDILQELAGTISLPGLEKTDDAVLVSEDVPVSEDHLQLLETMGYDPISIDQLVDRCALTAEEVSSMLLIMELEGKVAAMSGGLYQRLMPRD